ncbi:MAG: glycosyl hydrolase family 28-related protein [Geminicoccaceae bacterium]
MTTWDVTRYGATRNGGGDDTSAINYVINTLARPGDTVLLPAGTYDVTGSGTASAGAISIRTSGITLAGAGQGQTVVRLASTWSGDLTGIVRIDSGTSVSDVTIRDLTIDGQDRPGDVKGLYVGGGSSGARHGSVLIQRITVTDVATYAIDPHSNAQDVVILDSIARDSGWQRVDGKTYAGFTVAGVLDAFLLGNLAQHNGSHGFNVVSGSADVGLVGNVATGNADNGVAIQRGSSAPATHDVVVVGTAVSGNGDAAIRVGEMTSPERITADVLLSGNQQAWSVEAARQVLDLLAARPPGAAAPTDAGSLLAGSSAADRLAGGSYGEIGFGMGGADVIEGGGGNDILDGGSGGDRLTGGNGGDLLLGGSGADTLVGGNGADLMMGGSGADSSLAGGSGNDLIHGGSGNDVLFGEAGDDVLMGGGGGDRLWGGAGNDWLRGGSGIDTLGGGDGRDVFVWTARSDANSSEIVADFRTGRGGDVLAVGELLSGYAGNAAPFVRLQAGSAGTLVSIDPDGNGSASPYALALLQGVSATLAGLLAGGNLSLVDDDLSA